jgi:hypothetical protein
VTNLMREIQAEAVEERRGIVDILADLHVARQEKANADARQSRLTARVKQYLALEEISEVTDDERGIRAWLQPQGETTWDCEHMRPEVLTELAKRGLLTVNTAAFDKLMKTATNSLMDEAKKYRITGEGSPRLMVEAVK